MKKTIVISIILLSAIFVSPKIARATTDLSINLNHQNLVVGQSFTADIIAQSADKGFSSGNFEISFDRAVIGLTGVEVSAGSLLGCVNGTVAWSDPYNAETGTILAQAFREGCDPLSASSPIILVRLNFTAIGAGETSLAFIDINYSDSASSEETSIISSSSQTITVVSSDAVGPSLAIGTASGSTDTSPITITGTVSDSVEVAQVTWSNDRGGSGQATVNSGSWTFNTPLEVGDNVITVSATDTSDNTSSENVTITYAPAQAVVSLSPASQNVNLGNTFTVTLRVSNVTDLDNMNANIYYDSVKSSYVDFDLPQDIIDSGWDVFPGDCYDDEFNVIVGCINILANANLDLPQSINGSADIAVLNFTAQANGSSQFTFDELVSVLYATGSFDPMLTTWNSSAATIADNTAPQISITSPTSNPTYSTATSPITISGTASDNVGVTSVTWLSNRGRSGSAVITTGWSASVILSSGDNIITFTVRDAAGNTATDTITVNYALLSLAKAITAFNFNALSPAATGSINESAHTVSLTVPYGTSLNSLAPTITITGASISPASGAATNFTNPVTYTVTAANASTQAYTVTITVASDNTAPEFSLIVAGDITTTGATISWTTDEPADSRVEYGLTENYGNLSALNTATATAHSVPLSELIHTTAYHYRVISKDIAGNTATSTDNSFTTTAPAPVNNSGGGGGGGGGGVTYCSNVVYRDWGLCVNGFQYRVASSSLPIGCSLTTAQQLDSSRTCVLAPAEVLGEKTVNHPESNAKIALTELEQILADAAVIYNYNQRTELSTTTKNLYTLIIQKSPQNLTDQNKYAIASYIHNGLPSTEKLGAGERTGALNSYFSAFGKLPKTEIEWQDVVKIANGRWPGERNNVAETKAKASFKNIYGRAAKMEQANDNAAVTVMAYGLRPSARNLNSEKAAILAFKYFIKRAPVSAADWDMVRAIAYSGAKR